jgi:chromosomal replication initiator protein
MLDELWTDVKTCLKENLSALGYQTFLSSAKPLSYADQVLKIEVPNSFSIEWIKEKCEPVIKKSLVSDTFKEMVFDYSISRDTTEDDGDEQLLIFQKRPSSTKKPIDYPSFNPKYTFDNFIVGHNNRFAHAASEAVAKAPAKAYNPLFLYGSVGLGKTHLLHSIGLQIIKTHPNLKIKFVSSEKFVNELINSIKDKKVDQFRNKYRKIDVLMVDDIQFLAGKEQTQVEFFHTFNELHSLNKQIILTSDRSPKEIPALEVRLRTRFEWGLIADIQPPEFETRIAILRKKAEINQFDLTDEILHFIATQIPSNVREMEGALTRIVAYASLLKTDITLSIASNVIKDMVGIKQEKPLSISHIKGKVCDYFRYTDVEMCSKNRTKELVYARQIAMYLARELTNVSLPKIGENFGNRDHSTVMHACDKIRALIASDTNTQNIVNLIISEIKKEE